MKNVVKSFLSSASLSVFIVASAGTLQNAQADVLLSGWDENTSSPFGEIALTKNDDRSSGEYLFAQFGDLGFNSGLNFFGQTHNGFYVNNNGNITFGQPLSSFTPEPFDSSEVPMIAPFWGDVDTRCDTCGDVYIGSPDENTLVITWDSVAGYGLEDDPRNTFQLVLIDREDTGAGNFDVEFRYEDINWISGTASGGVAAQAGFNAGVPRLVDEPNPEIPEGPENPEGPLELPLPENDIPESERSDVPQVAAIEEEQARVFFTVPGSRTEAVADLDTTASNTDTPGVWRFAIREGVTPGDTPENPILPVTDSDNSTSYNFEFEIITPDIPIFIDPLVAVGYDYIVNNGPSFTSVILPTGFDDNLFDLWLWDDVSGDWYDAGIEILADGTAYVFDSAIDRFRILGIDVDNGIDPADFTAFITGLTFDSAGTINMNQNAITEFVDDANPVNAPAMGIFVFSMLGLMFVRRRQSR